MRIYGLDFSIYQPVISTLLPLILSTFSTFKWHTQQQSRSLLSSSQRWPTIIRVGVRESDTGAPATYPLIEADDGPQTASDCTAAAQAAAKKPLNIDGQVLPQASVHPADAGFEFLWRYLREERGADKVHTEGEGRQWEKIPGLSDNALRWEWRRGCNRWCWHEPVPNCCKEKLCMEIKEPRKKEQKKPNR